MNSIKKIEMKKLKYLDESHFISKALQRTKGISKVGERCIVVDRETKKETFSVTLLSSIDPETIHINLSMRKESNTALDFLETIKAFVEIGIADLFIFL